MKPSPKDLSEKQREWLAHIKASRKSGLSISEYARSQGLVPQHLYTWTTRFRRLGILETKGRPGDPIRKKVRVPRRSGRPEPVERGVRFSPVELLTASEPPAGMRIRFSNGVILDMNGTAIPDEATVTLLASLP